MSDNLVEMSPLQLKQLIFGRIYVEAVDASRLPDDVWAPSFDMTGVLIQSQINVIPKNSEEKDSKQFVVVVAFKVSNPDDDTAIAPYNIDMEAQALFEIGAMDDEKKCENLVRVNGASIIIGAIREQVTQLTARSVYGPLTLPTLRILPKPD